MRGNKNGINHFRWYRYINWKGEKMTCTRQTQTQARTFHFILGTKRIFFMLETGRRKYNMYEVLARGNILYRTNFSSNQQLWYLFESQFLVRFEIGEGNRWFKAKLICMNEDSNPTIVGYNIHQGINGSYVVYNLFFIVQHRSFVTTNNY